MQPMKQMLTGTTNSVNLYEDFLLHKQKEIRKCKNRYIENYIENKKVPCFSKYYFWWSGVLLLLAKAKTFC